MRLNSIVVENFRAIRRLELTDLPDAVVVAGPNGCGKSSLFQAILLLKSAYGQYHPNEYQTYFNQFQINVNRLDIESRRLLHDPDRPLAIRAEFEISEAEREYLRAKARDLYLDLTWGQYLPLRSPEGDSVVLNPAAKHSQSKVVVAHAAQSERALLAVLDEPTHRAELDMVPGGELTFRASPVVQLMFNVSLPEHLGIVHYHPPHRTYTRERVGGISLQVQEPGKRATNDLYNTNRQYNGIKGEMAQAFVRHLLAREYSEAFGGGAVEDRELKETVDELFAVFLPGKEFLGPRPTADGHLEFPVRLENGLEHDVDELSSGEKEVILGYLRLRNSAPSSSIVLLDEPELHLNPRLIRGLPRFYQERLGEALGNQLWMITHSDTLLREAVDEPAYGVYHMRPAHTVEEGENQLERVQMVGEVEEALIDLVGDLAAYSPRSKVLFVEGEGAEFDASLIARLFPAFADRVNVVPVGSKTRVQRLHDLMERASAGGRIDARFFSVVDRDFDGEAASESDRAFSWDAYHVENYLLDDRFVHEALDAQTMGRGVPSEAEVSETLRACAASTVDDLVRIRLEQALRRTLRGCLSTGVDRRLPLAEALRRAAARSRDRIDDSLRQDLDADRLRDEETRIRAGLMSALEGEGWRAEFRGRDVLNAFVHRYNKDLGVRYEAFRNMIVDRMRVAKHRPAGMDSVLQRVLDA